MPTSISVTRTPDAEIGQDAPVSFEEPQVPIAAPPSPHGTNGGEVPESADPLLDLVPPLDPLLPVDPLLPASLRLDVAPELLPELLVLELRPELLPPELPVLEVPPPEPPPLDGPPAAASPQSDGLVLLLPQAAASARATAMPRPPKRPGVTPENVFSLFIVIADANPSPQCDKVHEKYATGSGFVHLA